ncbi:SEC-C metal-binding domain-containing protein [Agrobacterium deltaense]|uniref:SEC-C metal-binding domain-containing protein n=1 Tax=Agrobacterium deltaense TaxID=1183412 RepID=UPI0009BB3D47|nr:SEC-C metal-binding domain-containing protein [Agrobacterium deltaense]CUX10230.1 conserved hypothetical protein [Agrobacterium deltaense RV3]
MSAQGRNEKCDCGSGKKYKNCCLRRDTTTTDTGISSLILEAGRRGLEAQRSERDRAEQTLRQLLQDQRATKDDRLNASLSLVGVVQRRGDHNEALELLKAIKLSSGSEAVVQVMSLTAVSLTQLGKYDDAAALFDQVFAHPASANPLASGWWELEAGRTYYLAGRIKDAIRVTNSAAASFETKGELEHLIRAKSNLASFMLKSEKEDEVELGERLLEEACDLKISIGDAEGASTNFCQLSLHHFSRGRFEKAIAYGRKDLKLSRFVGDERLIASTLGNMASIYLQALQLTEARRYNNEAKAIGERLQNPDILDKCSAISEQIEEVGRFAGANKIGIGKLADCACNSGKNYIDCCGRADHEPIALRMPIGGVSEDVDEIKEALEDAGLTPIQLDFAMRNTSESRRRIAWSEMRGHDGWFEMFELPDMANMHLNAAESLAAQAAEQEDAVNEPIACAMLAVSALEAFINTTIYFAKEAAPERAMTLPQALLDGAYDFQRFTELTQKWDLLGAALCKQWPPPAPLWSNFVRLVQLRNELVHYKAEGFARVAPAEKHLPEHLRNLPPEITLRDVHRSWPIRLLTPSFATWAVAVANDLIHYFRSSYRFALVDAKESTTGPQQ